MTFWSVLAARWRTNPLLAFNLGAFLCPLASLAYARVRMKSPAVTLLASWLPPKVQTAKIESKN